jgi:[CysO sulfur-carrier protein]-S-L-cysteine hydrolase
VRSIRCAAGVVELIVTSARHEQPRECCGLLLGHKDEILEAVALRNVAASADRFQVDPVGHIQCIKGARDRGLIVAGVFHSHPRTPAEPSPRDLAEAPYPEYLYGIVSLRNPDPDFRLFELVEGKFEEVAIVSG